MDGGLVAPAREGRAQAVSDTELLETVTACHSEAIRTMKWTVQKAKGCQPQILAS